MKKCGVCFVEFCSQCKKTNSSDYITFTSFPMNATSGAEPIQLTREQEILDCLYDLYSVQNGCPLPKYEQDWNNAMRRAEKLLGIEAKAVEEKP